MSCRQNIIRCILVPIVMGATPWAIPFTYGQRQRLQNVSANTTSFAGWKETVHLLQCFSVPVTLVLDLPSEQSERGIHQTAGKSVVLDHSPHIQILNADRVESPDEISRDFVHIIETGIRDLGMNLSDPKSSAFTSVASLFTAGEDSLCPDQLFRLFGEMPRVRDALAVGECCEPNNTEIYSNGLTCLWQFGTFFVEHQGDMVSVHSIFADGNGGRFTPERPGPPNAQSADPRETEVAVASIPLECAARILSGLRSILFLEGWVPGSFLEKVAEGQL